MNNSELLTILATIISTLLFTGLAIVIVAGVLLSLLIGLVNLVATVGHNVRKEIYARLARHNLDDSNRHSVDSDVVVVR